MSSVMMMAPTRVVSTRSSSATVKPRAAVGVCRVVPKAVRAAPLRMAQLSTQFGEKPAHALFTSRTAVPVARKAVVTKAADGAVAPAAEGKPNMLVLGSLFAGWYAFNIYFNIYNKQILTVFPYPWTNTSFQFLGGLVIACVGWATGLVTRPTTLTAKQLWAIAPLAVVHTLGNLLTNVSLGKVAVSFTHTIKAMEPFFSVVLSGIFLGDAPSLPIILSLCPIVGGVVLASVSEVSFNWAGFLAAMGSNLTFQSRNVLSKKLLAGDAKKGLDNINLFSIITCMSFFLLAPFTLLVEGMKATPAVMTSMGLDSALIFKRLIYAAFCFHMYQQVSYVILSKVTPVTHSVGNSVKRVVVIVSSVIFFRTPVSFMNGLGTAIALMGVIAYSQVKRLSGKK